MSKQILKTNNFFSVKCLLVGLMISLPILTKCNKRFQHVDPNFRPIFKNAPTYPYGEGPIIWIDEAHNNIVSIKGRYEPFIDVLLNDGYRVKANQEPFSNKSLADKKLLVIGNALHNSNINNWSLPSPSAFTEEEIEVIYNWVSAGGRLLFLTDHMPLAGAMADLAAVFGITFINGFVEDPDVWDPLIFQVSDSSLVNHIIIHGYNGNEIIDSVATFHGAAFNSTTIEPLLVLGSNHFSYNPTIAWDIDENTPIMSVNGWLQGGVEMINKGRIAVFADATMFSAQISVGNYPMGMNATVGKDNQQFLLNVLHWLTGKLDYR